jgi:hypothetical protein
MGLFDHFLRKLFMRNLLAEFVFESWVKLLGPPLSTSKTMRGIFFLILKYGMQHGTHCLESRIGLYKASLACCPKLGFMYIGFMHEFWTIPTAKMAYARL